MLLTKPFDIEAELAVVPLQRGVVVESFVAGDLRMPFGRDAIGGEKKSEDRDKVPIGRIPVHRIPP